MGTSEHTESVTELSREQRLIREYFAPLARGFAGADGLEDDACVIGPAPGHELVVTKDMLVSGVHFFGSEPANLVAQKALRTNISDIVAKGARPFAYLLGLGLPDVNPDWLSAFAQGLETDQGIYDCHLAGGDTVCVPGPMTVSITAFGEIPSGQAVRRSGAKPGDRIYVSGTIGDSVLGLSLCAGENHPWTAAIGEAARDFLVGRYRLPEPKAVLAGCIRDFATAAMDVSDGLVGDLELLCAASGVGAEVNVERIPLSEAGAIAAGEGGEDLLASMITGGDDYEVLCTVSEDDAPQFEAACEAAGSPVGRIGTIRQAPTGVTLNSAKGDPLKLGRRSYSHIR